VHELPHDITEKIDSLLEGVDPKQLKRQVEDLTKTYASKTSSIPALDTYEAHLAYLVSRLPATFAVNKEVFSKLDAPTTSLLDVGAGPATAFLALHPKRATLVERDAVFIALGKKLVPDTSDITWEMGDICTMEVPGDFDVVCSSYLLSELSADAVGPVVEKLWQKTAHTLVLIETGTPKGYERIIQARSCLINNNATILHPCPHQLKCPMLAKAPQKWCHFRKRIARTKQHRLVKSATLGYEDEPYCYLIASRKTVQASTSKARLVDAPCKRSGHVLLSLCTPEGALITETVSKKQGDRFRQAKKAHWGDLI